MYHSTQYPRRPLHIGDALRWGPLGPGGDPQMSLQDVMRWGPLGPGGDPQMSLQGALGQSAEASYEVGGTVKFGALGVVAAGAIGLVAGMMLARAI